MKYLYLIWSNLKRKKIRTILTLLSIMVAFMLFGYLGAIKQGFSQGVDVAGLDRLVVRHKISIIQLLPQSYESRIEQIEGVEEAVHQTWFGGVYQKPSNFFAQLPVNPGEYLEMYPEFLISEAEKQAWLSTRSGAIAGRKIAERFGWKVGDRIPINATIWTKKGGEVTWEFDLVGIYDGAEKGTDTTQFLFRYDFFDEARQFGQGLVGWYSVRISDPSKSAEIAALIDAEFANSPAETKSEAEGAFVQGFADQIGDIGFIMTAIIIAVFFTMLLVAGNTMAYAVRERTNELAMLKAIGFSDGRVLGLVLGESFVLTGIGGALGLALAWLMVSAGDPTNGALPFFFIPVNYLLIGVFLVGVMALVAGILPALQAQRLRIADALRR
ncbi:MAG: FtsX-like permease family protein [Xanthomonadales bacterium]|nr:FtsX-like permease family protein [Gammaproteobacteria bacterium]MBT8052527.1 FtsX-like permease family protein [Gammaproteobacteria bacterium]NND57099.1 FtsX-like permease family protein [Xanthomonadales bacterium]NNK52749.1 FtsX-like permease family protein [Xanthomonadales bacterium]